MVLKRCTHHNLMPIAFLFAIVLAFFVSNSADAKLPPYYSPLSNVMTYQEIMKLSPAKRMEYVNGIRALLVEIDREKFQGSSEVFKGEVNRLKALLEAISPHEAEAATCSRIPVVTSKSITCNASCGLVATRIQGDVLDNTPSNFGCRDVNTTSLECKPGFYAIKQGPNGYFTCVTKESWAQIRDPKVKRNLSIPTMNAPTPLAQGFLKSMAPDVRASVEKALRQKATALRKHANPAKSEAVAGTKRKKRRASARKAKLESKATAGAGTEAASESGTAGSAEAEAGIEDDNSPLPELGAQTQLTCENVDGVWQIKGLPEEPDPATCSDESIAAAKAHYLRERTSDTACIYGGNFTNYTTTKRRANKCMPRSKFCYGDANCLDPNDPSRTLPPAFTPCKANEVICNPLVFGLKADGESPFCVARGRQATQLCDQDSANAEKAVHPMQALDQGGKTGWKNTSGFFESWNGFAEMFNKMCDVTAEGNVGARYFCRECHIIRKRLIALRAKVVGGNDEKSCSFLVKCQTGQCVFDPNGAPIPSEETPAVDAAPAPAPEATTNSSAIQ